MKKQKPQPENRTNDLWHQARQLIRERCQKEQTLGLFAIPNINPHGLLLAAGEIKTMVEEQRTELETRHAQLAYAIEAEETALQHQAQQFQTLLEGSTNKQELRVTPPGFRPFQPKSKETAWKLPKHLSI